MSHTPPGWYSEEDGRHCYWDGGQWSEQNRAAAFAADPGLPESPTDDTHTTPETPDLTDHGRLHRVVALLRRP